MAYGLRTSLLVLLGAGALWWALPGRIIRGVVQWLQTVLRRPRIALPLIWVVALIPIIHLGRLVWHYAVNVPIHDDWAMAPLIIKAHTGQLTLAALFQQQQEARTVLPNLIFVLSARSEWNVRELIMLSVVISALTAAGLFVLLRRSKLNFASIAVAFWLMVLALFSTGAFELWLFAAGFPSFLPLLFVVAGLVVIGTGWATTWKFVLCVLIATASTFTLAHGLLAWALTFPILLLSRRLPRWPLWATMWSMASVLCAALYFWNYKKPVDLPALAPSVPFGEYVRFILEFLGGGLAYSLKHQAATAATIFGAVQLALLAGAICYAVRNRRDREFAVAMLPWMAIALHSMGAAALACMGRVAFGSSYALASRYVPFSVGLTLGLIGMLGLIWADLFKTGLSRRKRWCATIALVVLLAGYLFPYKVANGNTHFFVRAYAANNRLGKGALLFCRAIDTTAVIKTNVFPPGAQYMIHDAEALDDLHLLRPPLVRSTRIGTLPHEAADGVQAQGACETLLEEGEFYRASGWALLKRKRLPAYCVVVAYESPGADPVLVSISDSVGMRWDIAQPTWPNDFLWTGWSMKFPRSLVPAGATLSFWAVDADEPRLYRLEQKAR